MLLWMRYIASNIYLTDISQNVPEPFHISQPNPTRIAAQNKNLDEVSTLLKSWGYEQLVQNFIGKKLGQI